MTAPHGRPARARVTTNLPNYPNYQNPFRKPWPKLPKPTKYCFSALWTLCCKVAKTATLFRNAVEHDIFPGTFVWGPNASASNWINQDQGPRAAQTWPGIPFLGREARESLRSHLSASLSRSDRGQMSDPRMCREGWLAPHLWSRVARFDAVCYCSARHEMLQFR